MPIDNTTEKYTGKYGGVTFIGAQSPAGYYTMEGQFIPREYVRQHTGEIVAIPGGPRGLFVAIPLTGTQARTRVEELVKRGESPSEAVKKVTSQLYPSSDMVRNILEMKLLQGWATKHDPALLQQLSRGLGGPESTFEAVAKRHLPKPKTVVIGKPTSKQAEEAKAKVSQAPAPTAKQQAAWEAEAQQMGIANTLAYAQQKWLAMHNLKPEDVARAGKIMPGVTTRVDSKPAIVVQPEPIVKIAKESAKAEQEWIGQFPEKYQQIAKTKGIDAMQKAYKADHIKLEDSKGEDVWIPRDAWNNWSKPYQDIARTENYDKAWETYENDLKTIEPYRLTLREAGAVFMWSGEGAEPMSDSFNLQKAIEDAIHKRIDRDSLERAFGEEAFGNACKIYLATHPRIAAAGAPPVLTKKEFAKLTVPSDFTDAQIKAIAPFVLTGERGNETDMQGMLKAGVDARTVYDYVGGKQSGLTLKEVEWQAKFQTAKPDTKIGMLYDKATKSLKANPASGIAVAADLLVPGVYLARH